MMCAFYSEPVGLPLTHFALLGGSNGFMSNGFEESYADDASVASYRGSSNFAQPTATAAAAVVPGLVDDYHPQPGRSKRSRGGKRRGGGGGGGFSVPQVGTAATGKARPATGKAQAATPALATILEPGLVPTTASEEAAAADTAEGSGQSECSLGNSSSSCAQGVAKEGAHAEAAASQTFPAEPWPENATTVMLRNIPNRYTAEELLAEMLAVGFQDGFDFFYLPIDFHTKRNRGYCFINFVSAGLAKGFLEAFHQQRLTRYTTQKILEVAPALTQGFDANVAQYVRKDAQRIQNPWFRPMIFSQETGNGEDAGDLQ
ncbi:unnamed protein product [Polarella glacialis]|uniref:Mei2-like C-terminal RNA recognition motif domain-containing protein n=2 Tax=Polarella glacialis TaxID=89957 RepID=A0A813H3Q6_POLGL|nr:unnamed protein product [Polarella glacialis]